MNTTQLECFVTVADELSFSRAAVLLHISQPAVSHQIKSLETEMNARLVARSSHGVQLTNDGLAFLSYAREILSLAQQSKTCLEHARQRASSLRIGCPSYLEMRLLTGALRTMRTEDPSATPALRMGSQTALVDLLAEENIDAVPDFQGSSDSLGHVKPRSNVRFHPIATCPFYCLCAPDHALAAHERLGVKDLEEAGCAAVVEPRLCPASVAQVQVRIFAHKDVRDLIMGQSTDTAMALAEAGLAFSLFPVIKPFMPSGLAAVPVDGIEPIFFGVWLRRGRTARPVVRFVELLEAAVA